MITADKGKDSQEVKVKGYLSRWLIGGSAFTVAMLLVALALDPIAAQAQVPGATYTANIDAPTADCGGGSITVQVHDEGASIRFLGVSSFKSNGTVAISGSNALDPGAVPIAEDGSFTISFPAAPLDGGEGFTATISGKFAGNELDGTVNVSPSTCGDVSFTATLYGEEAVAPPAEALVFEAPFEPIFDFLPQPDGDGVPDCGGGQFVLTVYPERTGVFSIEWQGNTVGGASVDGLFKSFEPGEQPIDEDGSFSWERRADEALSSSTVGSFDFDADPPTVTGTLTTFPTADPSNIICEQDFSGERALEAAAVPVTGSGPTEGSGDGTILWVVLAAALGVSGLAAMGLAIMRRRGA